MTDFNQYYMLIAIAIRERANCKGRKVGAIFVKDNRIIGTGYNGTPDGMTNCEDGGCVRCKDYRDSGALYDKCICVHAEENALVTAARFGHSINGATVYTTLQPCFTCLKEFLQAKVKQIYYLEELNPSPPRTKRDKDFLAQYKLLLNRFEKNPKKIDASSLMPEIMNIKKYLSKLTSETNVVKKSSAKLKQKKIGLKTKSKGRSSRR